MRLEKPGLEWQECLGECLDYEEHHPQSELEEVFNYLTTNTFDDDYYDDLDETRIICFIKQMSWVRSGTHDAEDLCERSQQAVEMAIGELELPVATVFLMHPETLGDQVLTDPIDGHDPHWSENMEFCSWSAEDESWLLLSLKNTCKAIRCEGDPIKSDSDMAVPEDSFEPYVAEWQHNDQGVNGAVGGNGSNRLRALSSMLLPDDDDNETVVDEVE